MITGVRDLSDLWKENSLYFGNKANILSYAAKYGESVLPGFCVTFDANKDFGNQLKSLSFEIEQSYWNLVEKYEVCQLIVRSSVDLEDGEDALFPGIFHSISGVKNLSDLFQAIQNCYNSIYAPIVDCYSRMNESNHHFRYFTALIQIELCSQYGGLAATYIPVASYTKAGIMLVSLTQGNNRNLVKGIGPESTYSLSMFEGRLSVRRITGNSCIHQEKLMNIFQDLYCILSRLRKKMHQELEIEWGYAHGKVYIFQIRFFKLRCEENAHIGQEIKTFTLDKMQGFKYQAMRFFQKQGLFPLKTIFYPKQVSAEEAAKDLLTQNLPSPITVRFSEKSEIGLPRFFASNKKIAADYVRNAKRPNWSVIVYSSITVRKSYELYIDRDMFALEYVPGMWESDSSLAADTVTLERDRACFWLVKQERNARYENENGVYIDQVPPTSLSQMRVELSQRIPTFQKLQKIFSQDLPLNFHFVSDGKQDYFLNCRRTCRVLFENRFGGSVQLIEDVDDCKHWDGKSSILFRPKLFRGEELLLLRFVPFLRSVSVPIFVEFGILSHPAIMLREFGISIMPYFLHHNYYEMLLEEI